MTVTVRDVAQRLGGTVEGRDDLPIRGLAGVAEAGPGDLTFLSNMKYAAAASQTKASALIAGPAWTGPCPCSIIRVADPDRAFADVARTFFPPAPKPVHGISPLAAVSETAELGPGVSIGPFCVLEAETRVGARSVLYAGCYLGRGASVGEDCVLYPHVSLREYVTMGHRCIVHNGAVIGSDGFGYTSVEGRWQKIPQVGTVQIGDDVEIGANATVDRARFGRTVIGTGVKIDNLVQVAHNVRIGEHTAIAAQTGIAGSTEVGSHVQMGGQVGVSGHLKIGDHAVVGAQAGVTKDVPPATFVSDYPAMPHMKARRIHAHVMKLPEMKKELDELDRRVREMEKRT
jgi:UDP-3-O-[3-hydroxymyristoyl] glucosamine N-acyltransferase